MLFVGFFFAKIKLFFHIRFGSRNPLLQVQRRRRVRLQQEKHFHWQLHVGHEMLGNFFFNFYFRFSFLFLLRIYYFVIMKRVLELVANLLGRALTTDAICRSELAHSSKANAATRTCATTRSSSFQTNRAPNFMAPKADLCSWSHLCFLYRF